MTVGINAHRRIITAIWEHIEADKIAVSVYVAVSIDKSLKLWVIVTAIEVVESRLGVVVIATVAQRGFGGYCLLRALRLWRIGEVTPSVIGYLGKAGSRRVIYPYYVTLV